MQLAILFCLIAGAFASFECPANSKFNNCGSACPLTCDNYQNPPKACVLMCVPGCHCNEGYVKTKDGRCVEPENCPSAAFDTSSCLMKPDPGMCRAYFPMFYYDAKTGACEELIYGGCQGNDNRFATEAECLGKCGGVRVRESGSEVCGLPLETGVCNALFHRYGFNKKTGKCEKFVYGGCGGNGNRFESLAECESTCSSKQASSEYDCDQFPESGNCRANIMRFWYDQDDGKCKKFTYGGCGGNRNNFATEQDCYKKCVGARAPQSCQEEKAVGSCFGAFPRYFYNKVTGQCEQFIYGGCEGNSNNFNTIEDCEAVCL